MLRRIHAINPAVVPHLTAGSGPTVLVHGDYGPQNTLFGLEAREVTAVVDWEWAHAGNPVEDLAWCEWIIRMHHPGQVRALNMFFAAYGHRPPWRVRHEAMLAQSYALLDFSERWQPGGSAARLWRQRLQITESWAE
jgi:aminoglycoside phosphotransferase (APT) family kinase protein